jgi:serine/threonine protein phosphatase PrpC
VAYALLPFGVADVEFHQVCDAGRVRRTNEDAVGHWPHEDGLLFAVADGLGDQPGGEVASQLALAVVSREMERASGSWPLQTRLKRAVQEANLEIYTKSITVPELRGMATTLTASAIVGGTLVAAHVGNCRLFLLRGEGLSQLTKDHTWVWEQIEYGKLTPESARTHPRRDLVTRCLGRELIVAVDLLTIDLRAGDVLLQCSDGVHEALPEAELAELLAAHPPAAACRALLRRAREEGTVDDVSAQVASITDCPPPAPRAWWRLGR